MRMYKNGREIFSRDKAGSAVATGPGVKIGIGNQSVSAGPAPGDMTRPFAGRMDEVLVYDRGLSVAEITCFDRHEDGEHYGELERSWFGEKFRPQ